MRVRCLGLVVVGACAVAAVAGNAQAASQFAYVLPQPGSRALLALSDYPTSLVQVDRSAATAALLRSHGGKLTIPQLNVWRLPTGAAQTLTPQLERSGVLSVIESRRPLSFSGHLVDSDPLVPQEWWMQAIGADTSVPPGPGVSVTDVDSGLDVTHPEFAGRPDTTVLNVQTTSGDGEWHGTAVSSVVAAPVNGVGVVGVYPQASYKMWDASPAGELTNEGEVAGILDAAAKGPTVINLSLGSDSFDPLEQQAVMRAYGAGSLVVAAAGNFKDEGNPLEFPASLPHVLTVGASTEAGIAADFSSSSPDVDIVAPGVDMPVAVTADVDPSLYHNADGTSFAAPLASGVAAWVATLRPGLNVTQLGQLLRTSATDIAPAGYDNDTGYGLLNIPAALTAPVPPIDPQEPNDDISCVRPKALFAKAKVPLTTATTRLDTLRATIDFAEDPDDVYRVVVPAKRTLSVTLTPSANLNLTLWGTHTKTVLEQTNPGERDLVDRCGVPVVEPLAGWASALKRDRLARSANPGRQVDKVVYKNKLASSQTLYVDVSIQKGLKLRNGSYSLRVAWH